LKEETKMNNFLFHSSLIEVLGAEQSAPKDRRKFPENGENLCGRREFDIRKGFDKPCQYNRLVQYGRDAAHKSRAACAFRSLEVYMNERQYHLRGSERELFSQTWRKSAIGDSAEPK
jgi:hypothetical protein